MSDPQGPDIKPQFATNDDDGTVAQAVAAHLDYIRDTWAKPAEVAIATAYFNPGGYSLIAEQLDEIGPVKLLLGVAPDEERGRIRNLSAGATPKAAKAAKLRQALSGHVRSIEEDRDLLGYDHDADVNALRLVEWLRSGDVEVRRFEKGFLHGKAFMVSTDDEGVIAGSSNFTFAGLARNRELNLGHYDPSVVERVREWFEGVWDESEEFDLAAIYESRFEPHNPYLIYMRMLLERYGPELEMEAVEEGGGISLTTFQRDGLWRARRLLRERHGVLIADGVGLGKTFLAGELIREAVSERRQRVLLITPAALRDGPWKRFLLDHGLGVESLSFEELSGDTQLNPDGTGARLQYDVNDYAMVVIDEAHGYRNPDTRRAAVLRKLLQGSPPKDVVLLTATPVNNSLWDLYYLLTYFVRNDAAFADAGVKSLEAHFRDAMALDPEDLSAEALFDVLDAVAVRRTRHFVKRYYPHDTVDIGGVSVPITFPKSHVVKVDYDLGGVYPHFFERFAHALDCTEPSECEHEGAVADAPILHLARYAPSRFRKGGEAESYEIQLAGLLRSGLLKRFESSSHAFALTCDRMADSHDAFLELLDEGFVGSAGALTDWIATDSDDFEGFLAGVDGDLHPAAAYDVPALREATKADRDLLRSFAEEARQVPAAADPKLLELQGQLREIADEAEAEGIGEEDVRDKSKVIIFSYFAETIEWVKECLDDAITKDPQLSRFAGRTVSISGSQGDKSDVLFGFAPISAQAPAGADDRYDLLFTTDVLAEGVNLQQARHIINYDLPWNPMRLVQRHGRIDRIGSAHDDVFVRCFFPDTALDALLGLEERLLKKLHQAAASVGVEGEVLPGSETQDVVFIETREEIARLRAQDPTLLEAGGEVGTAYSGEEYRQELRAGLQNPDIERAVRGLPWGSGSGMAREGAAEGFVFCARVGDHPVPQFRYVERQDGGWDKPVEDTLTCLSHAFAAVETERILDEETRERSYEAWGVARNDILASWLQGSDPAHVQARVPKAMRDAAQLLRSEPPTGVDGERVARALDAIEAPYGNRIQKLFRDVVRSEQIGPVKSALVLDLVAELGLQPAPAADPLPVIESNDIMLVSWMAIVPA